MRTGFPSNLALILLAAFEAIASQAFAASVFTWLAFAGGIAAIAIVVAASLIRRRGTAQRVLDGLAAVLGAGLVLASLIASAPVFAWLGLGGVLGVLALGVVGLSLHEVRTERVVHSLELRSDATSDRPATVA